MAKHFCPICSNGESPSETRPWNFWLSLTGEGSLWPQSWEFSSSPRGKEMRWNQNILKTTFNSENEMYFQGQQSSFRTRVSTQQMESGPAPDTAAFIQRMEENKRKEEKGEVKDNRSFLAKYWMYIVPVVLFMALNGAAAPQQWDFTCDFQHTRTLPIEWILA